MRPRRWLVHMQSQYQLARAAANDWLKAAIQNQAERHNADPESHGIEQGSQVDGYTRKMAHMWHGPFWVAEVCGEHAVRL